MIETLSKEILDTAYYGFMYEEDYPVTEARFYNNNLKLLSIAIRKMFGLLNIEKDLSVLDKIHVFILDKKTFCCAYYCSINNTDFLYTDDMKDRVENCACNLYREKVGSFDTNEQIIEIIQGFEGLIAHANKTSILINRGSVPPQLGLHLVCHEIMHSLASIDAVNKLRGEGNDGQIYGDEAINEYFARLATLIFNSMDEPKNKQISGYTNWDNEQFFNSYPHSTELGLYGAVMATDNDLIDNKWNDNYYAVERVKELARFYFIGK